MDITCKGGDVTKGEQLTDDGSTEWKGDITVLPTEDRIEIKIKANDKEVELEDEFVQEEIEENISNNEIWYKTSDNKPIEIYDGLDWGTNEILSNEYDPIDDCCKIIFKENVTEIPNSKELPFPPPTIKGVFYRSNTLVEILKFPKTILTLGNGFLSNCPNLIINLTLFSNVTKIGNSFLTKHSSQSIDLTPLSKVTSIGSNFLSVCSGLQSIDLTPLSKVTSIGSYFLYGCSSLEEVDLSSLSNTINVGPQGLLCDCEKLKYINCSNVNGLTGIGIAVFHNCPLLERIDICNCKNLETIETYWENDEGDDSDSNVLCLNNNLKEVNIINCPNLTSIGTKFLYNCSNLQLIDLSGLFKVTSIGTYFLYNCTNLKTFIIDHKEGLITLPLEKSRITPDNIYVNDKLLEQYKEAVPKFADKFKLLSNY